MRKPRIPNLTIHWLTIALITLALAATALLRFSLIRQRQQTNETILETVSTHLEREIEEAFKLHAYSLIRLAGRWDPTGKAGFPVLQVEAETIIEQHPGLQAVEWADADTVVRWIVPLNGNEPALNLRLADEPRRRAAALVARATGRPTFTRPINLRQGGRGFLLLVPIQSGNSFRGYIVGVFQADKFFASVLENDHFQSSVRILAQGEPIFSSYRKNAEASGLRNQRSLSISGIDWDLTVTADPSHFIDGSNNLPDHASVIGVIFALLLGVLTQFGIEMRNRGATLEMVNRRLEAEIRERETAESALRLSEGKFRQFFVNYPNIHWVMDPSTGGLISLNPAFETLTGRNAEEYCQRPLAWLEMVHEEDRPKSLDFIEKLKSGEPAFIEVRLMHRDGSVIWLWDWGVPIRDEAGVVREISGICENVTEFRQSQEALKQSEHLFRQFAENLPFVIWMAEPRNEKILYTNSAFQTVFGRPVSDSLDNWSDAIHPSDKFRVLAAIERIKQGGLFLEQYRVVHSDGTMRWVLDRGFPILDDTGEPYMYAGLVEDITDRKAVETALRESEHRFRQFAEHFSGILWMSTPDNEEFLFLGPAFENLTGWSREQLVNEPLSWFEIIHPDDRQMVADNLLTSKSVDPVTLNFRVVRPSGEVRWVRDHGFPMFDERGRVYMHGGIVEDITDQKEAENALRESEGRFQQFVEHFSAVLWMALPDTLEFLLVSPAYETIFGRSLQSLFENPRSWLDAVHPEDRSMVAANLLTSESRTSVTSEFRILRPDGTIRWLRDLAFPMFDEFGKVYLLGGFVEDITERKLVEMELRESEERFRTLADSAPVGIFQADSEGFCIFVNEAVRKLGGMTFENMIGSGWTDMLHAEDRQAVAERWLGAVRSETDFFMEFRIRDATGETRWLQAEARPYRDETGKVAGYLGTNIDITERILTSEALNDERAALARRVEERTVELQSANAELARANRLKDEFLANMSHELRTPLANILGLAEVLQEQLHGPVNEVQAKLLRTLENSGNHLLALITDILDLSKIEAGKLDLVIAPVGIVAMCQSALQIVRQSALKKRIDVSFTHRIVRAEIPADERRLKQILLNLLSNAVRFTPDGGQVGLDVQEDIQTDSLHLTVWDTGIGIAPENLPRLFQPFVQLDSGLTRRHDGTGLGLSLVARLSKMHGGTVAVESRLGTGSRFTVTIPFTVKPQPPIPAPTDEPSVYPKPPPRKVEASEDKTIILVAEDNPNLSFLFTDYFSIKGHEILTAGNGLDALNLVSEHKPDIILMDVHMPGIDGLEATRRIRSNPELAGIKIIVLTGQAMAADRQRCLDAGADEYIAKPCSLKKIQQTVEAYLPRRSHG